MFDKGTSGRSQYAKSVSPGQCQVVQALLLPCQ